MCRYENLRAEVGLRSNTQISSRRATTQKSLKNKSPLRCPTQVSNKRTRETIWGAETQKIVQMARTRGRLSMGFGGSENGRDSSSKSKDSEGGFKSGHFWEQVQL